jgi:phosphoenolpyruvate synthase/pyruvate phosphate dikinase
MDYVEEAIAADGEEPFIARDAVDADVPRRAAHAAIVSRELGIPCVVGTGQATTVLTDGQIVTVDGSQGKVYEGRIEVAVKVQARARGEIKTKTKLLVNLAQPELADRVAARDVDGVGSQPGVQGNLGGLGRQSPSSNRLQE